MFECKACEAKTEEIEHLRSIITELQKQLEKATARVMELAAPGIERRMASAPAVMPRPQVPPRDMMPGYEWRQPEPRLVVGEEDGS